MIRKSICLSLAFTAFTLIFFTIFIKNAGASTPLFQDLNPCSQKLKEKVWPIDCLMILKFSPSSQSHYHQMDLWCQLYEDQLKIQPVPDSFFALSPPPYCKKVALANQIYFDRIKIIEGEFLDALF